MVCMKWTSESDRNVSNSCQNRGAVVTCQLMVCALKDFKVLRFRNHFAAAKWVYGLWNGTRVPKGGFAAAKHPSIWRLGYEMEDFKAWRFRNHFATAKWMYGAAKCHSCAKGSLHSCENFRKWGWVAAKPFCSRGMIFAAALFWLWNFAGHALSLLLSSSWFSTSFLHLFWHSSWFWSSKNLCYIKTN